MSSPELHKNKHLSAEMQVCEWRKDKSSQWLGRAVFLAAGRGIDAAWRFCIAVSKSSFQQAVSPIAGTCTRAHTQTLSPLTPAFPAPGWCIGWCLPCVCRVREKEEGNKRVCVFVACPSESISVSYPWAVSDPWPTLLSVGSWSLVFCWDVKTWEAHWVLPRH